MSLPLYHINNWDGLYENNRTRELKSLTWVPFPNSHDTDGYTALLSRKRGEALLGAFVVIVQVASKCDPRGTLLRGPNLPHTAASLARMTRFSEETLSECLEVCSDPEIGWIICENPNEINNPAGGCGDTASSCGDTAGGCLEGKGREGKEGNTLVVDPVAMILETWNGAGVFPKVKIVTPARKKAIRDRLKDEHWKIHWKEAIGRAANSTFLTGGGGQGWRMDFDWFLKADSLPKIIEGKYDDKEVKRAPIAPKSEYRIDPNIAHQHHAI